jgi:hypothetical protein
MGDRLPALSATILACCAIKGEGMGALLVLMKALVSGELQPMDPMDLATALLDIIII